jgi:sec-independent protein translocase protein TatA
MLLTAYSGREVKGPDGETMLGIGAWELTIILLIVLVLFGGKRLPGVATGLGQAIRNFRGALKGDGEEASVQLLEKNPSEKIDHSK